MWRDDQTDSMQYGRLAQLNPIKAPCRQIEGPLTAQLPSYIYSYMFIYRIRALWKLFECQRTSARLQMNGFTENGRVEYVLQKNAIMQMCNTGSSAIMSHFLHPV